MLSQFYNIALIPARYGLFIIIGIYLYITIDITVSDVWQNVQGDVRNVFTSKTQKQASMHYNLFAAKSTLDDLFKSCVNYICLLGLRPVTEILTLKNCL